MNINLQRFVDRWAGIPLCAAVSGAEALMRRFRPAPVNDKTPRAIVVILLSEMGSLVLANDMFARLKARYPDAALHALLFKKNREILDLMQVMDPANVHTVDDRSLTSLLSSLWSAIKALRSANVDVAIDCELFSRISSLLSYASGAAVRVGFHRHTQEGLYRGSHINRRVPYNPYHHISAQFLTLARAIDSTAVPKSKLPVVGTPKPPPHVQLDGALVQGIQTRLAQDFPAIAGKPLVLVYPGGGILPIRAWPLASYTALCEGLVADGCAVAVIGLKDDQALARQLVANVQAAFPASPVIDLTGYTRSISELLALFHGARLLVTNDGGPGQFAALTPIWTLMLFGPETPSLYAPLTPQCYSFYSQWPCSPCLTAYNHRSSYCDGDNQCLKVIAPAAVLAKARAFLASA
ncbi:MAG: glycosyltransferase family 9 protein [Polaromonas sp.]|uniref:glycosyltransferase family 9 protein n=1 Tax=Polaromonas sp. TaxID=1869339 RepID=UPI0027318E7A|nr:glycosyltransferase family 9 protein [Polaromonas sp.]MDP2257881.1 glycosyltransferase family 9 protein [Polaromonas sp.]MDP3709259.1 glycosyltransferase family 9 protein [Polaromonas sp.]